MRDLLRDPLALRSNVDLDVEHELEVLGDPDRRMPRRQRLHIGDVRQTGERRHVMLHAPCKVDRPGNQQRRFLAGTDARLAAQLTHCADELLEQRHRLLRAGIMSFRPRLRERLHRDRLAGFARERRYVLPELLGDEWHERVSEPQCRFELAHQCIARGPRRSRVARTFRP